MNFEYDPGGLLEAYERLIYDALIGDKTLFARADGIERLWEVAAAGARRAAPGRSRTSPDPGGRRRPRT